MSASRLGGVALLAVVLLAGAGCVERMMFIRSDPPGAPVWVDEQAVRGADAG